MIDAKRPGDTTKCMVLLMSGLLVGMTGCSGDISASGGGASPGGGGGTSPTGTGGDGKNPGGQGGNPGKGGTGGTSMNAGGAAGGGTVPSADSAGPLPLRRLTREEYNYTVRDLLADTSSPANLFDADQAGSSGYEDPGVVDATDAKAFSDVAEQLANNAVRSIATLLPCDPQANEASCTQDFIRKFGARAYRRPLTTDEVAGLQAVFDTGRTTLKYAFNDSIRMVLQTMLQSPNFLYHWELTTPPAKGTAPVALDNYALASRLSYFLWRSMPDAALFQMADGSKLMSAQDVETQARRMLKDDRAKATIESFHVQWLGLQNVTNVQRDVKAFPDYSQPLLDAMLAETKAFVDYAVLTDGKAQTLLTAPFSFVNSSLAKIYGIKNVTSATLQMTTLPSGQRKGILTQPAFLTMYPAGAPTHPPVQRGKRVYNRVLCGNVQPPGMVPALDPPPPGLPLRQHFEEHSKNPVCAACHHLLDPVGFAFESFDSLGKFRTTDTTGAALQTAATLTFPASGDHSFADAIDLITQIAGSPDSLQCLAQEWFRFAAGRAETPEDDGSRARILETFKSSGGDIRELLVAIASSKSFMFRKPSLQEDAP